jgi:prephenate dehydrogenase
VLDLGSTKVEILRAMGALPDRFDPLGGHPMCGKERSSLKAADAQLFRGQPFAFTPLARTSAKARRLAGQLAAAVGARPIWIDAGAHDRWVAATSHLPYLLASALSASTPPECAPLVGPGFRSTSRLASTSPEVMLDILITNRSNLLEALSRFQARLDGLERWLESGDWPELLLALTDGAARREAILAAADRGADREAA